MIAELLKDIHAMAVALTSLAADIHAIRLVIVPTVTGIEVVPGTPTDQ